MKTEINQGQHEQAVNVRAYVKTEHISANVVRENYKTKESEAMLHHHNHPRQIGIHYHKNATNKNQISY
jgi:hypothetical protein